ncbi:unnamed protein product, partial [Symbiodinium pilosum]
MSEAGKDSSISASAVVFPKEADFADTGLAAVAEPGWQEDDGLAVPPEMLVGNGKEVASPKKSQPEPPLPANISVETQLRAELYAARDEVQSLE